MAGTVDLAGRTVLVTGAGERSLGFATAEILASWGADVVVTTRSNTEAVVASIATAAGRGSVTGHSLDLAERRSVAAFASWYTSEVGRLDVLVNNAGIHLDLRRKWTTPHLVDGHEIHWRTNYLGAAHLTDALLPLLRESGRSTGDARVVNVVSKLYQLGSNDALVEPRQPYDSWAAYGTSKLALIHHALELERRYGHDGVRGYAVHPGEVYTHIADHGLETSPVLGGLRRLLAPLEKRALMTAGQGAQTQVHCATAPDLLGGYYRNCAPDELNPDASDATASSRLWERTGNWLASPGIR